MLETGPMQNHIALLIKSTAGRYFQLRYHYAGRVFLRTTDWEHDGKLRLISKFILIF